MPILLTTPYALPASLEYPAETYNEVKISMFAIELDSQHVHINCRYGNTVDGVWMQGRATPIPITYEEHDPRVDGEGEVVAAVTDYSELVYTATTSAVGLSLYTEVKNSLYQKLIDEGNFPGTII